MRITFAIKILDCLSLLEVYINALDLKDGCSSFKDLLEEDHGSAAVLVTGMAD